MHSSCKMKKKTSIAVYSEKNEVINITDLSNTLPNPRAVMIKVLNTVITFGAVGAARRPVYHASFTVFHFHRHTIDHNLFYSRKLKSMWS